MKIKLIVLTVLAACAPLAASATHEKGEPCAYTDDQSFTASANGGKVWPTAIVYADVNGNSGSSGSADAAAGACMDGTPLDGTAEAGYGAGKGADYSGLQDGGYVIVDGAQDNDTVPMTNGYIGISNYEYTDEDGNSTNGGGQAGANDVVVDGVPVACGSSAPQWDDANYDGCVYYLG